MNVDDSGQMFVKGRKVCASCEEAGIDFHFHRFAPKRPQIMIVGGGGGENQEWNAAMSMSIICEIALLNKIQIKLFWSYAWKRGKKSYSKR